MSSCSRVSTVPAGIAGVTRPTSSNPNTTPKTTSPNRWRKATAPFASALLPADRGGYRNDRPDHAHRQGTPVPKAQLSDDTAQRIVPRSDVKTRDAGLFSGARKATASPATSQIEVRPQCLID